jgi:DNA end-binding protein Ku
MRTASAIRSANPAKRAAGLRRPGGAKPARAAVDEGRPESRPLSSAMISFGLVTIPVELRSATRSLAPAFHLVHGVCGSRIEQQIYCPVCRRVVERSELVRGFDVGKDQYVVFTPEELEHLEGEASRTIDIAEFVPLAAVDPIYYETAYYLAPAKDGEKAYGLLTEALEGDSRVALATFLMRGKENLVALRAVAGTLILHTLFFADEIRARPEGARAPSRSRPEELRLARRLIGELAHATFEPERYEDAYRGRVLQAARAKAKGRTIEVEAPATPRAPVVSIMDALKASLEGRKRPAAAPKARGVRSRLARQAS